MKQRGAWLVLTAVAGGYVGLGGQAQDAADLVTPAADALRGRDRLLAIRTLTIEGYVQQHIGRQIANARQLCASVEASGLTIRGCPVKETVDR